MNLEMLKQALAESQKREQDLKDQVAELSDFIENASLPLHWVNGSGIVIWANKVELEFLGYEKSEYIGKHISNFHADKDVIEDILRRLMNKETLRNYPARLKCKNGDIKPVLINSNVLWRGEEFVHTRCFTRDITEIKKLADQKIEVIMDLQSQNSALKAENEQLKKKLESYKK